MATKIELEQENQMLNENMLKMQEQMKEMMFKIEALQNEKVNTVTSIQAETKDISSKKIRVISLCNNQAILSTGVYGSGKQYDFPTYGTERRIRGEDLEKIIYTCKKVATDTHTPLSFFERGLFYIADNEAVIEYGLEDYYDEILDKSKVDQIVALKDNTAVNLFRGANKDIKENIVSMIVDNIVKNDYKYDRNLMAEINEIYGKDIFEIAEKATKIKIED